MVIHGPQIIRFPRFENILIAYATREEIPLSNREFATTVVKNRSWSCFETPPTSGSDSPRSQADSSPFAVTRAPITPWFPSPPSDAASSLVCPKASKQDQEEAVKCPTEAYLNREPQNNVVSCEKESSWPPLQPIRSTGSFTQAASLSYQNAAKNPYNPNRNPHSSTYAAASHQAVSGVSVTAWKGATSLTTSSHASSSVWCGHASHVVGQSSSQHFQEERNYPKASSAAWFNAWSTQPDERPKQEEVPRFHSAGTSVPQSLRLSERRSAFVPQSGLLLSGADMNNLSDKSFYSTGTLVPLESVGLYERQSAFVPQSGPPLLPFDPPRPRVGESLWTLVKYPVKWQFQEGRIPKP